MESTEKSPSAEPQELTDDELLDSALANLQDFLNDAIFGDDEDLDSEVFEELAAPVADELAEDE